MKVKRNSSVEKVEILVAEDSPMQAGALKRLLVEHGYKVTVAGNGVKALEAVRRRKPTLIISDIVMPEMDGYMLCRKIKSCKGLRDVPVILLSSMEDVIQCLECGADNFIRKPYEEQHLLSRLKNVLSNRKRRKNRKRRQRAEILLGSEKRFVSCERQQIADLLISVYEEAIHMNQALETSQRDLARSSQALTGVYHIAEGLNRCLSEREVVEKALERAMELPGVRAGWITMREGETGFRTVGSRFLPPALECSGAMEGDCLCRRLVRSGSLSLAVNVLECERLKNVDGEMQGLCYHASIPLWNGEKTLGVMNLAGTEERMFNDMELKTLQGVGHHVAVALERARLVEHLEQTVEARTAALRVSERWFRTIFHSQLDAVLVMSPDRRILSANPAAERMFGYSLAEMKDRSVEMLHVDHEHFVRVGERVREALEKGEVVGFEFDFKRKNDEVFPTEKTISLLRNDVGEPVGIIGTFRDLADRKRSEEERSRLISILETTTDFIGIGDVEGRARYLNGAGRKLVGLGPDDNILRSLIQEYHPEWARRLILDEGLPAAARDGVWNGETALLHRDGSAIPVSQVILAHKAPDGAVKYFSTIARDISERKQTEEKIRRLAYYDILTNLPNRTLLYERLEEVVSDGQLQGHSAALLIMDIDRFKEINDTLGHDRGDFLLKELGRRLREVVWEPDLIARLGGDEFAILFPKLARAEDVHLVVIKVLQALEEPFLVESLPIVVEPSIGIALYPDHGSNASSLLRGADVAMYAAKKTGSGYLIYDPKYDRHSPRRLSLLGELRRAIEANQLLLLYQPKINLRTRRIVGVEALVRWQHPTHGLIPPDDFIPPAEKSGLIGPLTRWVLNAALRQCGIWRREGLQIVVAVNLSRRNLLDPQLVDHVAELISNSGVSPSCLELEITESAIMADPARAADVLTRLDRAGIRLSIDDFGTGYSSLASLRKLPVKELKVDKSFVLGMEKDENDTAIVRSTIGLAHNLGLRVVAEGVENETTWDLLFMLGCDEAQGYYISRPFPPENLTNWIKDSSWGCPGTQ